MPTNKTPFTFHMDDGYLRKMKIIAKEETRSLSNLLEHLCRQHIARYEQEHGEIKYDEDE
jgi:predicted transcriptional regulator